MIGAHTLPSRRSKRNAPSAAAVGGTGHVRFCGSRYRVFVFFAVFYVLILMVAFSRLGATNLRLPSSQSGGAMHGMLMRAISNNNNDNNNTNRVNLQRVEEVVQGAVAKVGEGLAAVEQEAEYLFLHAHNHQQLPPVVIANAPPVEEEYAVKLKEFELVVNGNNLDNKYRSCRWRQDNEGGGGEEIKGQEGGRGYYSIDDSCPLVSLTSESGQPTIVYFNPHKEKRIICGQEIASGAKLEFKEPCREHPRLFRRIPDLTAQDLPVVTTEFRGGGTEEDFECDIPCRVRGSPSIVDIRTVVGTDWTFDFSMEGPQYYGNLNINPDAYQSNHFYSTTSYRSEVPLPYFSWAEYKIHVPGVDYDTAIKAAVFLARNCNSRNNREEIIRKLQASSFRVDSLSSCLRNAEPPPGVSLSNKKQVMSKYLFYLAFENQNVEDYVTEKLWGPFESGTVPVYYGAPNVKEHVPNNSIIAVNDFDNIEELAEYLNKVASDKQLYESYQTWRYQPLPPHFHAKYDFTHIHSTCRTCRWAHARLYGLGWEHFNQSLRELTVPRTVCVNDEGLVDKPFVESWWTAPPSWSKQVAVKGVGVGSSGSCNVGDDSRILSVGSSLQRTIWEKDGVLDLVIRGFLPKDDAYALRIQTPLMEDPQLELIEPGHVRIQNNVTRFTILTLPRGVEFLQLGGEPVSISSSSSKGSSVLIRVHARCLPLRVRAIVEDIDLLHQGASQVENYFGSRMKDDFYNPVESFYLVE